MACLVGFVTRVSQSRSLVRKGLLAQAAIVVAAAGGLSVGASSHATMAVELSSYADARGYINAQELTWAQPTNSYQEDVDMLATWYNGWYNGLAKKHYAHLTRAKTGEHKLIVYCKAHPDVKIIQAVDLLLKNEK